MWLNALERIQAPDVQWDSRSCSRVKWPKSSCRLCQDGCPVGALSLNPYVKIDEDRCTSCGACISLCPNGAFSAERRGDPALVQEMKLLIVRSPGKKVVRIGCRKPAGGTDDVLALPCLGRLTEALVLAPFALGGEGVEILQPNCNGCTSEGAAKPLEQVLSLSRHLLVFAKGQGNWISVSNPKVSTLEPHHSGVRLTRRGLFGAARHELRHSTVALLHQEGSTLLPEAIPPGNHKRANLLAVLKPFEQRQSLPVDVRGLPLAAVEVGETCAGCNVCETVCAPGALRRLEMEDAVSLIFKPHLCTGCAACQQACLFKAITLGHTYDLSWLMSQEEREVAKLVKRRCIRCHREYRACSGQFRCPACRIRDGATSRVSTNS